MMASVWLTYGEGLFEPSRTNTRRSAGMCKLVTASGIGVIGAMRAVAKESGDFSGLAVAEEGLSCGMYGLAVWLGDGYNALAVGAGGVAARLHPAIRMRNNTSQRNRNQILVWGWSGWIRLLGSIILQVKSKSRCSWGLDNDQRQAERN